MPYGSLSSPNSHDLNPSGTCEVRYMENPLSEPFKGTTHRCPVQYSLWPQTYKLQVQEHLEGQTIKNIATWISMIRFSSIGLKPNPRHATRINPSSPLGDRIVRINTEVNLAGAGAWAPGIRWSAWACGVWCLGLVEEFTECDW